MKTPTPLPMVRSGTSLLSNHLLPERWQACHQAVQSGLGEAGKSRQATEQLLLVPITTTVLLKAFSISLRRSSPRGYSWLNTAGSSIALGEEGKRTGVRNQFSGGYQAELSCLCVSLWQCIAQSCAQVECLSCCVRHYPARTQEQNQSSSVMFFGFILYLFLCLLFYFPSTLEKSHHSRDEDSFLTFVRHLKT